MQGRRKDTLHRRRGHRPAIAFSPAVAGQGPVTGSMRLATSQAEPIKRTWGIFPFSGLAAVANGSQAEELLAIATVATRRRVFPATLAQSASRVRSGPRRGFPLREVLGAMACSRQ